MMSKRLLSIAALVAIAIASACSDSGTAPRSDLTADQLQSMTSALSFLLGISLGHPEATLGSPAQFDARRVMADALPITGATPCPEGGHVGVNGTFDVDTAGNSIFALTDTLVACAIKDNHSNVWTFTSKPTLAVTIGEPTNIHGDSIDISHSSLTQADVGTVQYSIGSLTGTCPLNISIELDDDRGVPTADSATISLHTHGTVCEHTVSRDTSSTVGYTPPQL